ALPGMPPPFLGTAVAGDGGLTAGIDAYGDVVDLRARPGGRALIDNPAGRQAAGTVPADTGIVPRVAIGSRPALPLWRADSVRQRYRRGTDVVVTTARFGSRRVRIAYAAAGDSLACLIEAAKGVRVRLRSTEPAAARRLRCDSRAARRTIRAAKRNGRQWLQRARPLGAGAPTWAGQMYRRSLLVLQALTDRRTGAVIAGARDGWAYVWPRDAATAALAFDAAGYRHEARQIARFLGGLELGAAARFYSDGEPVPGRGPQGDALGWVAVAERSLRRLGGGIAGQQRGGPGETSPESWQNLPDYQEGEPGNYLGNALAAGEPAINLLYGGKLPARLLRQPGNPASGLDSAAAWAVRPFGLRVLYPAARETMLRLARRGGRFGITPGTAWPGEDPWTAPTAWTVWSLAALSRQEPNPARAGTDRRVALRLLADLRRAATPAGALPERVDAQTGVPRSTTPLAWSHAFAILALLELWPPQKR
ncbi:MAG: glycoside hydrolase family 15 protein, partial [Solirubrobacterales bacterium]